MFRRIMTFDFLLQHRHSNAIAEQNNSRYGLIRSLDSWRKIEKVGGERVIVQPVAQQACGELRWWRAYEERGSVEGGKVHGRYYGGVVDLFVDEEGEVSKVPHPLSGGGNVAAALDGSC